MKKKKTVRRRAKQENLAELERILTRDRIGRSEIFRESIDAGASKALELLRAEKYAARCVVTVYGLTVDYEDLDFAPPGNQPWSEGAFSSGAEVRFSPQRPTCYTEVRISPGWVISVVQHGARYLCLGPVESARIRETLRPGEALVITVERLEVGP